MALFCKQPQQAEAIYLQSNLIFRAIEVNINLYNWERYVVCGAMYVCMYVCMCVCGGERGFAGMYLQMCVCMREKESEIKKGLKI